MIFGTVQRLIVAAKQKKASNAMNPIDVSYEDNAQSKERMGMARMNLNGRMAGAGTMERNIAQNQANTMASVSRNATSGAQALAMAGAAQGQANAAMSNLQTAEAQDYNRKSAQLSGVLSDEGGRIFGDKLRKYQQERRAKDALMQASMLNTATAFDNLDNGIATLGGAAMGGAKGGAKKGKKAAPDPFVEDE